jgi:hypothetical protein
MKSDIFLKINCILAISQDISGKIVDIPNNLTIKVYCNFRVLPDLGNFATVGTTRNPPSSEIHMVFNQIYFFQKKAIIMPQNPIFF